jgi:hypothetical protein
MANITVTNCDRGSVALANEKFRDELLTFAGTDTFAPGTILARQAVAVAVTASAVAGGTGTGTLTLATVVAGRKVPKVGVYTLRLIEVVAHGGIWQLEDPDGAIVATDLRMTAGSGVATIFEVEGMQFTVTDATDFIVGNTFTLTVAADGTLVPFNPAGAGGAQFPIGVLTYEVSRTGAGTVKIRAMLDGEVNKTRLLIDVDGHGTNITAAILDQLRAAGVIATDVSQLNDLDNQ